MEHVGIEIAILAISTVLSMHESPRTALTCVVPHWFVEMECSSLYSNTITLMLSMHESLALI